jgi:hypothetical protein
MWARLEPAEMVGPAAARSADEEGAEGVEVEVVEVGVGGGAVVDEEEARARLMASLLGGASPSAPEPINDGDVNDARPPRSRARCCNSVISPSTLLLLLRVPTLAVLLRVIMIPCRLIRFALFIIFLLRFVLRLGISFCIISFAFPFVSRTSK